jgi:hypothetical protein
MVDRIRTRKATYKVVSTAPVVNEGPAHYVRKRRRDKVGPTR